MGNFSHKQSGKLHAYQQLQSNLVYRFCPDRLSKMGGHYFTIIALSAQPTALYRCTAERPKLALVTVKGQEKAGWEDIQPLPSRYLDARQHCEKLVRFRSKFSPGHTVLKSILHCHLGLLQSKSQICPKLAPGASLISYQIRKMPKSHVCFQKVARN